MRRFPALLVAVSLSLFSSISFAAQTSFVSGTSTQVNAGNAVNVCLNGSNPSPCPAGATLWNYGGGGWGQSLASIPGAHWIWAPGLSGSDVSADADYTFINSININGTPDAGTVYMLADDYVELRVNGTLVGTVGSVANAGSSGAALANLVSFNVAPYLQSGNNTFSFRAINGPASFGGSIYSTNPAGVVFGGNITYTAAASPSVSATPVPAMGTFALGALALILGAIGLRHLRRS